MIFCILFFKTDKKTISHWLEAPNKRFKASKNYKGVIEARIPPKMNNKSTADPNDHYCSARVNYCMEFAAKFSKSCTVMSLDNKNKSK